MIITNSKRALLRQMFEQFEQAVRDHEMRGEKLDLYQIEHFNRQYRKTKQALYEELSLGDPIFND